MRSLACLALAGGVVAQRYTSPYPVHAGDIAALPPSSRLTRRQQIEPCAEVRELWLAQQDELSSSDDTSMIRVPAEIAYECLKSVPVDVQGDVQEITELKSYLEYQSTLAWLKKGVEGIRDPLDIMGGLDKIAADVKKNTYESDYDVQVDIRLLLDKAHDFHLQFWPDITSVFTWSRPGAAVVSLSADGTSLPKIYALSDTNSSTASPITKINGQSAESYLEKLSADNIYHDVDARYNTNFPNPPLQGLGADDGGLMYTYYIYPGPNTTFTFENGSQALIQNVAGIQSIYDFSNVVDGESFFEAFCSGPENVIPSNTLPSATASVRPASSMRASATGKPSTTGKPAASVKPSASVKPTGSVKPSASVRPSSVATGTPRPSPSLIGYPKPVAIDGSRQVSGYYLNDTNYNDVAVLVLPAFGPTAFDPNSEDDPAVLGFVAAQKVVRGFFADAVKQKKQKLVIDLRGNGGGTIDFGFELFKQLFPTIEPYGAARYRAHEAFHYYSAVIADLAVNGTMKDGIISQSPTDADIGAQSPFLWSNILDENNKPYATYRDYYGPETLNGDTFTSVRRYNFSNNLGGHTIPKSLTGYNEFRNVTAQPFKSENIVILQDGLCGSTCAIFAELMREQAKVQTIAVGGRPVNLPMQGVAGSKGSQKLDLTTLFGAASATIQIAGALNGKAIANMLNNTSNAVGRISNAEQIFVRTSPPNPGLLLSGGVNSLNNQRMNDTTETPLEFVYEAADCKLFYTKATYFSPTDMWKAAVDVKWGKGKCVQGSTGDKTAIGVIEKQNGFGGANGAALPQSNGAKGRMGVERVVMGLVAVAAMVVML